MYRKSFPPITIDCILSSAAPQYQADGCIYEISGTDRRLRTPGFLKAGDLVKLRLWLPNDDDHVSVQLAEVRWVRDQWIGIEFITMSPHERARMTRYSAQKPNEKFSATCDQILIRA